MPKYITEEKAINALKGVEAEDVRPIVRSKWIRTNVNGQHRITCEACDYTEPEYATYIRNWCPCCGARMY